MNAHRTLAVLLTLATWGCGSGRRGAGATPDPAAAPTGDVTVPVPATPTGRYAGHFEFDFEKQVFRPCGSREEWWAWGAPADLQRTWGQRTFVVVEGEVSGSGSYGHMSRYPRQIRITAVLKQEPGEGEGCPPTSVA